jgi:HK97 family phage major capsid protein
MTKPATRQIPKDLKAGSRGMRAMHGVEVREINLDARTVELAFSSEAPVERWWGIEILDHTPRSVRLDRLRNGGPVCVDHDTRDHVGVIEDVRIDADRVGRAVVRFGRSARASEILQDVADSIRRNVSAAYRIHAAVLERTEEEIDTYRVTDWEPYEISFVAAPADITVGVGRSHDSDAPPPVAAEPAPTETTSETAAGDDAVSDPIEPTRSTTMQTEQIQAGADHGVDGERKRSATILAIAEQFRHLGADKLASEAIQRGETVEAFQARVLERVASAPKPTADIGLSEPEKRKYSLMRAIRCLAEPNNKSAFEDAAFERECSEAAAKVERKTARGLIVPFDVLKRDLVVGTPTAGGNLVATNLLAGSFIDLLRNRMLLPGMGSTMLTGLVGDIAIPRQTGGATHFWVTENTNVGESQMAVGQVPMSPKCVGAFTNISRKLLLQSSLDVEAMVQTDLATAVALGVQSAAITGGGAGEPTGILSTAGIGDVAGGTNGLIPTWANIVELETDVAVANADIGTLGYLTNTRVRGRLKTTSKVSGQNGFIWEGGATPLNEYQCGVTNAVPSNLTKGTAIGNCSAIIFGNWADLVIGMWGGLDILVNPYAGDLAGTLRVVVHQDVDVALRNAVSFSAMRDALTP